MTRAMLVPTGGAPRPIEVGGLRDLQEAVGGHIEAVDWAFDDDTVVAYVNDEGKLRPGVQPNRAVFAARPGMGWDGRAIEAGDLVDVIYGDFVVAGFDPETGEDADLTDEQAEAVSERFGPGTVDSGPMAVLAMQLGVPVRAVA